MYNQNSGYGQAFFNALHALVPAMGKVHVVCDEDDVAQEFYLRAQEVFKPKDGVRFFNTLEAAYAAVTSNNNDVIVLSGESTFKIAAGIAWSKSRVHVIGMDGGGRMIQQGAKIESTDGAADAYVVKCTGTRNTFRNLKVIQADTEATALNVWQFAGEGNLYEDCSFIFGVADNLDLTTASEALMGEDAGSFKRCSFGTDVLLTSAARAVMTLDAISGGSADGAKSNHFEDCEWVIMSSSADALMIKLADTAGAKFLNRWTRPQFHVALNNTNSAAAITNAIASASSFIEGSLHFYLPASFNCTNLCAGVTDNVVTYAPATSATGGEGGTPA